VKPVGLGKTEQFDPAFLKISPNNKIPAIVEARGEGKPRTVFGTTFTWTKAVHTKLVSNEPAANRASQPGGSTRREAPALVAAMTRA
jgi:GST-like protein